MHKSSKYCQVDMMLTVYFIDRYTKLEQKSCLLSKYNRYNTVAEAKEACDLDPGCKSVYDNGCDESPNDAYLCPVGTPYIVSIFDCIFEKGNI